MARTAARPSGQSWDRSGAGPPGLGSRSGPRAGPDPLEAAVAGEAVAAAVGVAGWPAGGRCWEDEVVSGAGVLRTGQGHGLEKERRNVLKVGMK